MIAYTKNKTLLILLLNELTSALDALTEKVLLKPFDKSAQIAQLLQ
ncbi:hypothetical protein [Clostridium aceticum]|nr:hypothetical protein [Clostridium aceticum]